MHSLASEIGFVCSAISGDLDQRYRENANAYITCKNINFAATTTDFIWAIICVVIIVGGGDNVRQWQIYQVAFTPYKRKWEKSRNRARSPSFTHFHAFSVCHELTIAFFAGPQSVVRWKHFSFNKYRKWATSKWTTDFIDFLYYQTCKLYYFSLNFCCAITMLMESLCRQCQRKLMIKTPMTGNQYDSFVRKRWDDRRLISMVVNTHRNSTSVWTTIQIE